VFSSGRDSLDAGLQAQASIDRRVAPGRRRRSLRAAAPRRPARRYGRIQSGWNHSRPICRLDLTLGSTDSLWEFDILLSELTRGSLSGLPNRERLAVPEYWPW